MKICVGVDTSGRVAGENLKEHLAIAGHEVTLISNHGEYPLMALTVAHEIKSGNYERGVLICATGLGPAMMANKVRGIYATPCYHVEHAAKIASSLRAQIITLGCDTTPQRELNQIAKIFVDTPYGSRPNADKMRELERLENVVATKTSRDEVEKLVRMWQSNGETVAMASGTFELLHSGHLLYLSEMRSHADRLVVAVSGDKMASRKGADRPYVPEERRAEIVRNLRCVDAAFVYHEWGDYINLEVIKPNVFGRGDGYDENISEAETVKRLGIKLVITGAVPGLHSTNIIEKIKGRV